MQVHKHLKRLHCVWIDNPIYFITICTMDRQPVLTCPDVAAILTDEWRTARTRHGWAIGQFVIMPDHIHFFCRAEKDAKILATFIGQWKEWTSKRLARTVRLERAVWQPEFFDHILRSAENYGMKWNYVRDNPVRAGLVSRAEDWPWQGTIEVLTV